MRAQGDRPQDLKAVAPMIIRNELIPTFISEIRKGYAIQHPMFPGVHCKLNGYVKTLALENYSIFIIGVREFVKDDGT
jgi:hypothetical protein